MADPENLTIQHLQAIRADLRDIERNIGSLLLSFDRKAEAGQDLTLTGLTHAVTSGFGSIIRRLDSIDTHIAHLEDRRE